MRMWNWLKQRAKVASRYALRLLLLLQWHILRLLLLLQGKRIELRVLREERQRELRLRQRR